MVKWMTQEELTQCEIDCCLWDADRIHRLVLELRAIRIERDDLYAEMALWRDKFLALWAETHP